MKLLIYILICSFLFAMLDWQSIHLTRWANRDWLEWMHDHERAYAALTTYPELVVCAPCVALKPIFLEAIKKSRASQEEQDATTHAPALDHKGFYHLVRRGESWTFVPWWSWFLYWLAPSAIWLLLIHKLNLPW